MERKNFTSLSQKKVKDEVIEITDDPASAMQWSFSNQASPHSQSQAGHEDRSRKTGYDSLTSTGYMTLSSTESLSSNQKSYSNMMQRNLSLGRHAGSRYPVANYPSQHFDAHAVQHPSEARSISNANRTNLTVHMPIITSSRPNVITSPVNLRPVEIAPASVGPSSTSVVGNTDLRNNTKIPKAPAQLTIFYSGLVCVYDNVSPEKAQAIMLLAGNAPPLAPMPSMTPNSAVPTPSPVQAPSPAQTPSPVQARSPVRALSPIQAPSSVQALIHRPLMVSKAAFPAPIIRPSATPNTQFLAVPQVEAPIPRPSSIDSYLLNQSSNCMTPGVGLFGHISITSSGSSQSAGLSSSVTELTSRRPNRFSNFPLPDAPRIVSSLRHIPAVQPIVNSSAVPQARKASLARFLEKRKERSTIASPYDTQSPGYNAFGQGSQSLSMNSASSSSLPIIITLH